MITFFPSRAVALSILGFQIHWYGLLYLLGFIIAAFLLPRLQKFRDLKLTRDAWYSLLSWSVIGVIAGGRLGYVLFYDPQYFILHPLDVFAVWQGGMSFHGGFLGVLVVLWIFSRSSTIRFLELADVIIVPVAIGLALGRFGNFINQELYGTVTTLPWGMQFPGATGLRHPIQFYEMLTDLLTALLCYLHLRGTSSAKVASVAGRTSALFLMLYGVSRFLIEYVREQQYSVLIFAGVSLTRGQLLTLPILMVGIVFWILFPKNVRR